MQIRDYDIIVSYLVVCSAGVLWQQQQCCMALFGSANLTAKSLSVKQRTCQMIWKAAGISITKFVLNGEFSRIIVQT